MLHVILYRPELASNTGNIMRTCAAIGAKLHVIGPFSFSLFGKEVVRAAMDYGSMLEVKVYDDYSSFIEDNHHPDLWMVSRYGHTVFSEADFGGPAPIYIMFGSESSGIPLEILRENTRKTLRIPMVPSARSLNLSNSVAVVAYEIMRQKGYENLARTEVLKGPDYL
ncbi:MAG: tRNA (cytidine(34)-2'-O)-methyltransferase [Bacilli bacterium]|jgi:tRNA (cytidine/uridine-2'-O-)-methyltransferase